MGTSEALMTHESQHGPYRSPDEARRDDDTDRSGPWMLALAAAPWLFPLSAALRGEDDFGWGATIGLLFVMGFALALVHGAVDGVRMRLARRGGARWPRSST